MSYGELLKAGVKQVGKGKVYWGKTLDDVLKEESISQDVIVPEGLDINWIHRKTEDADIYFVASKHKEPIDVTLSFRVNDVNPQIWDAFTGEQQDAKIWSKSNRQNKRSIVFAFKWKCYCCVFKRR